MDSTVPPGRNHFAAANPALCAGLISGVAPRQKIRVHSARISFRRGKPFFILPSLLASAR
jgi:hypothetical protein